jgi:hypothetical protein
MTGHHDFEKGYERGYADGSAHKAELLAALKNLADTIIENGSPVARLDATAFALNVIAKAEGK